MSDTTEKKYPKIGVNVFIFNDKGEMLMGKRVGKVGYGTWCLPGGHFEWGESLEDCAKRELEEETSLIGDELKYLQLINDPIDDAHFVHINFMAEKWHGTPTVTEPDKFSEWKWFDLNKLPDEVFIGHQKFVPAYLNSISFIDNRN